MLSFSTSSLCIKQKFIAEELFSSSPVIFLLHHESRCRLRHRHIRKDKNNVYTPLKEFYVHKLLGYLLTHPSVFFTLKIFLTIQEVSVFSTKAKCPNTLFQKSSKLHLLSIDQQVNFTPSMGMMQT